jgi:hypothetical protein
MSTTDDPNYGGFTIVPIITCTAEMKFLSKVVIVDGDGGRRTFGTLASHPSHSAAWEHAIGHAKDWIDRSDS